MSEGINFSDDMARLIIVAGLPFPDITDEELKTKMSNLDTTRAKGGGGVSGSSYYFNLCMRAVNQTIGRAIRHANDYACMWLCDDRYGKDERVWNALPGWIRKGGGGREWSGWREVEEGLGAFLRERQRDREGA